MSVGVCVLASGSSGNCTVVRTPGGVVLVDAGIGPRITARRMTGTGVTVSDVRAICLTHLDRDHFTATWADTILGRGIRVFCHASRLDDLVRIALGPKPDPALETRFRALATGFDRVYFEPIEGLSVRPIPLAHDRLGSHGFVLDGFGVRVGYATDLGRVPHTLLEDFCDLDLLAIESNYDPQMQLDSARPWFLKNRIMGGNGHLSNEQAFDAVRGILNRCEARGSHLPSHIVLLHRSRQCNCPDRVRRLFGRDARVAPRLVLAEQYDRSEWLRPRGGRVLVGEQLQLAWG